MQIKRLHKNIYKLNKYISPENSIDRYRKFYQKPVDIWDKLSKEAVSLKLKKETAGISRATYYRYKKILTNLDNGIPPPSKRPKHLRKPIWNESQKQLVLKIRKENPTYGKAKIAVILRRDHNQTISESTVGRIIKFLMHKGLITKSVSALRKKRNRVFKKHAKAWEYKDYKNMGMGEMVQIDHMTVTKNGITLKQFQAWERRSKYMFSRVYSNAKASSAKRFLLDFVKESPFKILSIQVDGGSEFMGEFEDACGELNIPLMVLPPSKPTYNGGVERSNRIFREEFYSNPNLLEDTVRGIQAELSKALHKYNHYRPHNSLKGSTPMEYILNSHNETSFQSHII